MSNIALDITLLTSHEAALRALLYREDGSEAAAYVLFGKAEINEDPWSKQSRIRLISHEVVPILPDEVISSSSVHVTWSTKGFMRLLGIAQERNLIPALVHTHPRAGAFFLTKMIAMRLSWHARPLTSGARVSQAWCSGRTKPSLDAFGHQ